MFLKNKNNVIILISRHQDRIQEKGQRLVQNHTDELANIERLQNKLCWLKKTYGLIKCMCNGFLKKQIAKIRAIIKAHKTKCFAILNEIMAWERTCQYPFI